MKLIHELLILCSMLHTSTSQQLQLRTPDLHCTSTLGIAHHSEELPPEHHAELIHLFASHTWNSYSLPIDLGSSSSDADSSWLRALLKVHRYRSLIAHSCRGTETLQLLSWDISEMPFVEKLRTRTYQTNTLTAYPMRISAGSPLFGGSVAEPGALILHASCCVLH